MSRHLAPRDRRLTNRLTTLQLALQMLERKTDLSAFQRSLVRAALEATGDITLDLLQPAPSDRSDVRSADGRATLARSESLEQRQSFDTGQPLSTRQLHAGRRS